MVFNQNDNRKTSPDSGLRDYAIDSTLNRITASENMTDTERRREETVIGNRSLSQFLGIREPAFRIQLFDRPSSEQDFLTGRYMERLNTSGSLADAGRDLANCLNYGTDYDLKLSRSPKMQFGPAAPTPSLNPAGQGFSARSGMFPVSSAPVQQGTGPGAPFDGTWPFGRNDDKSY